MHIIVGLIILAVYLTIGKWPTIGLLGLLLLGGAWISLVFRAGRKIPEIEKLFVYFETEDEEENWRGLGAQTLVLGSLIVIFFFSKEVVIPALLVLAISDAISAIAGTLIKSTNILEGRTVFGTTSFFISALAILYFFVPVPIAVIVAGAAALTELIPLPDDNIWIPITVCILLSLTIPFI